MAGKKTIDPKLQNEVVRGRSDIPFFAERFLGIKLHEGQKTWLKNSTRKTNVLSPGKRWGKTLVIAVKHIHHNFYKLELNATNVQTALRTEYPTLNVAPHSTLAKQCYDYVNQILESKYPIRNARSNKVTFNDCKLGYFLKQSKNLPYPTIWFSNGSVFTSRTMGDDMGKSFQGSSYAYISYDEPGASDRLKDEHQLYILPRLTDWRGNLDMISTPDMKSKSVMYFNKLAQKGLDELEEDYYTQEGSAYENTYIDPAELKRLERSLDPVSVQQIIYGKFVYVAGRTFPFDKVKKMFDEKLAFAEPVYGREYMIGVDLASTVDFTVIVVLDTTTTPYRVVQFERFKGSVMKLELQMDLIKKIYYKYSPFDIVVDTTSMGGKWAEQSLEGINPRSFDFKKKNKSEMLIALRSVIEEERIVSPPIQALEEELSWYHEDDRKLRQDCVMALGLAIYGKERVAQAGEVMDFDFADLWNA